MKLNMIRPRNQTEGFLLPITKICETLKEQTHIKAEETLEFKLTQPGETFSLKPPIAIEGKVKLTSLEVYISKFKTTEENNKFDFIQTLLMMRVHTVNWKIP